MEKSCIVLAIVTLAIGIGIGIGAGITLSSGPGIDLTAANLEISDIEWSLEGDYPTIHITVKNTGTMPISIDSISVRRNVAGATEYVWANPTSTNDKNAIAGGGIDVFDWNIMKGNAPYEFLSSGGMYIVKVSGQGSYAEETTTAPSEY